MYAGPCESAKHTAQILLWNVNLWAFERSVFEGKQQSEEEDAVLGYKILELVKLTGV